MAQNWADTLDVLVRITKAGLPVSWRKCQLLVPYLAALGVLIRGDRMQLGVKAIRKLFSTELPASLTELQRLLGHLNFAGQFVVDFRWKVRPLQKLLRKDGGARWTQEHTDVLNHIASLIHQRLALGLVNPGEPLTLHVDVDDTDMSAILVQGWGPGREGKEAEGYRVVAMNGKPLSATQAKLPRLQRLLAASIWALRYWARYTCYLPVSVVFPEAETAALLKREEVHRTVRQYVIEIDSFGCKFVAGDGAWEVGGQLARTLFELPSTTVEVAQKAWEHRDITLSMPQRTEQGQAVDDTYALRGYFDGASNRVKEGACGFAIFDPGGKLVAGEGAFLGDATTSNVAEARGGIECYRALDKALQQQAGYQHVVVRGDSQLVISFLQRRATPGRSELVEATNTMREFTQ